jgi:DNA-binding transcriptional ArsR family regulator
MKTVHESSMRALPLELIARRLKAMADPSRLAVLDRLCRGEQCVSELMRATNLSQTNLSKHLRILKEEGLVIARRNHRHVYYRLSSSVPEEICTLICRSMRARATGERIVLERYLDRRRPQGAGFEP